MPIETLSPLTLTGVISPTVVIDHDNPPSSIIKTTDHFHVLVDWYVDGTVVSLMGGDFEVKACFESIGPGSEKSFGPVVIPVSAGTGTPTHKSYHADIWVNDHGLSAGAYNMIVVLTYKNGGVPGNIAGFSDEKIIQVYDPTPSLP